MSTAPTVNALFIPADIGPACRTITLHNNDYVLQGVADCIGCEYVETVTLLPIIREGIGMPTDMWVDESGLLNDSPINVRASIITGRRIYGNAVITGRKMTREGDTICDLKFKSCVLEFLRLLQNTAEDWIANGYLTAHLHDDIH